jgi:serine O-acetyltransferase
VLEEILQDFFRYSEGASPLRLPLILLTTPALWASTEYRFGHWARTAAPRWARLPLSALSILTRQLAMILTGASIQPRASIGPGLYLGHARGIVINDRAVLGPGCTLSHEVTIGQDVSPPYGVPTLGRGVYVAPGAKVFGGIAIGDHVTIGANAVVRDDLPDRAVAVGIPARVVRVQDPEEVRVAEIAR